MRIERGEVERAVEWGEPGGKRIVAFENAPKIVLGFIDISHERDVRAVVAPEFPPRIERIGAEEKIVGENSEVAGKRAGPAGIQILNQHGVGGGGRFQNEAAQKYQNKEEEPC